MSRSENMRRITSRNTRPELVVRRLLRALGYRGYRLHRPDLPGRPDIAFIGRKKAVLVHGCFWHGHGCPEGARRPKSNQSYWGAKISRNRERDRECQQALKRLGWKVFTVWECDLKRAERLAARLRKFLD
jgi:DNA mismatch endonuclease (patch repair protein)